MRPEEQPYQMSDEEAPDVLGLDPGSGSPVTAKEDRVLDKPCGFSRAPGVGRPITGSGPAPPADGLQNAPQRDRRSEEDRGPRGATDED